MSFELFVTWVLVGLLTGWAAWTVMKDGSRGLMWDLVLGLLGSSAASSFYWALTGSPETGKLAASVVAFVGAVVVIVAQRKAWYAHA